MNLTFFISALFVLKQTSASQTAQDKCREEFHMDAESRSHYLGDGCRVNCLIHGKWREAFEKDGNPCHLIQNGRCHHGTCRTPQLGHIDIWFDRGEFCLPAPYYVVACIRNSSESVYHPIANVNQNCTAHCESTVRGSRNPVWNQACAISGAPHLFTRYSRVAFDVWKNGTIPSKKLFVGGADLLISDLFPNGTNGQASLSVQVSHNERMFINLSFSVPSIASCLHLSNLIVIIIIISINTLGQ